MANNSVSTNLSMTEQLQNMLINDKKLAFSIRSQSSGFLEIFIRKSIIQKIKYCEFTLQSVELLDDDDDNWPGIELPENVYRRFCLLIVDAFSSIENAAKYGSIRFDFSFEQKENDEWISAFNMAKHNEIHFDNFGKRRH